MNSTNPNQVRLCYLCSYGGADTTVLNAHVHAACLEYVEALKQMPDALRMSDIPFSGYEREHRGLPDHSPKTAWD